MRWQGPKTLAIASFFIVLAKVAECSDYYGDDDDYAVRRPSSGERTSDAELPIARECPFGWKRWGDNCYQYVHAGKQWSQAEKACADSGQGAHLASVLTKEELGFIFALITTAGTHWLHKEHQTYHSFSASNDFVWVGLAYTCPAPENARWSDGSKQNASISIEPPRATSTYGSYHVPRNYVRGGPTTGAPTFRSQQRCVAFHLGVGGGTLRKASCLDFAPYICKMPTDKNGTGDPLPKEDGEDMDKCDGYDWCPLNGSCYKILSRELSWYESRSACVAEGGDLVSIHSMSEIDYLNNNLTADWTAGNSFWTGLNKLESMDDRFQWSDSSPIDFLPSVSLEVPAALGAPRNPSCVSLKVSQLRRLLPKSPAVGKTRDALDSELQLSRCDTIRPAVCKRPTKDSAAIAKKSAAPTSAIGGCAKGWMLFRNRCYRSFGVANETASDRASFREAQQTCAKQKANLVSIQNVFDNFFVLSMLSNEDLNQSWLGLIHNEGRLKWIDETEVSYTNFDAIGMTMFGITPRPPTSTSVSATTSAYSSFYDSAFSGYGSYSSSYLWRQQERCFVISLDKAPGTWDPVSSSGSMSSLINRPSPGVSTYYRSGRRKRSMYWPYDWRRSLNLAGESCEQLKLPFICEKSKSANETSGEREWFCNDAAGNNSSYYKHGSSCFDIVTDTPSTWNEAKKRCEDSSSTLTSILSHQEFAFLVSLMKKRDDLPAFWIGMRVLGEENSTAIHSQWVDDWPVWITKWNTYPVGDKHRRCVVMSRGSGSEVVPYWDQESCQKKLPFICKHRRDGEKPPKAAKTGRCESGWLKGSTQCYKVKKDDWTSGANAMLRCWREHNATLASFPTEADWLLISKNQELKDAKKRFFIGLMQKLHGNFEWIDNSPLDYTNWAPQEPRFGWNPSVEVCVEMDQNGLWYDAGCHETRHFICSKPIIEGEEIFPLEAETTSPSPSPSALPISTVVPPSPGPRKIPSSAQFTVTSTAPIGARVDNTSESIKPLSSVRMSQKFKSGSQSGVIVGIVICVLFLLTVLVLGTVYVYRQRTQGMPLFRRRSADAMRFEILNEQNDEY